MRNPVSLPSAPATRTVRLGDRAVDYRLRRMARSRGLRVTIDPRAGLVVSVPPESRRGWAHPEPRVEAFLSERRAWVLKHLDAIARERDLAMARGGAVDGGLVPFRGELHRIRVVRDGPPRRRSTVERAGSDGGD